MSILENAIFSNGMSFPEAKKYVREKFKRALSPKAKGMMNDIASGFMCGKKDYHQKVFKTFDRITFDATDMIDKVSVDQCQFYNRVVLELDSIGYVLLDYIEGTCKKKESDNRIFKVGKILSRNKSSSELIDGFANSSIRSNKNNKEIYITLTINPLDVALMSTFQGWESCMSFFTDSGYDEAGDYVSGRYDPDEEDEEEEDMYNHVSVDILSGTIVAYVHETSNFDPTKTIGRYLLKPYFGFKKNPFVFFNTENNGYGTMPMDMRNVIQKVENEINSKLIKNGKSIYTGKLGRGLYNDSMSDQVSYTAMSFDEIFEKKDSIKNFKTFMINMISNTENHNFLLDEKFKDYESYIDIGKLKITKESYKWLCEDFKSRVIFKSILYSELRSNQKAILLEYIKSDCSDISVNDALTLVTYDSSTLELFKTHPEYDFISEIISNKTEISLTEEQTDILDDIYNNIYVCRERIQTILLRQFHIGNKNILKSKFIKENLFDLDLMDKLDVFNMKKEEEKTFLLEELKIALQRGNIFYYYMCGMDLDIHPSSRALADFIIKYFGLKEENLKKFMTEVRDGSN